MEIWFDHEEWLSTSVSVASIATPTTFQRTFSELARFDKFDTRAILVNNGIVYWGGYIGSRPCRMAWSPYKPEMVIQRLADDHQRALPFSFISDSAQAELVMGGTKVVATWLPKPPDFLGLGKEAENSVVFRINLYYCELSDEPNFTLLDNALQPDRVLEARGIVRVRNRVLGRSQPPPGEKLYFVVFPPDAFFSSQSEEVFLHISDQRQGQGGEEYFLRFDTITSKR